MALRPAQAAILEYTGGSMGIAAVPGSGKTWTLSQLAVSLIRSGLLQPRQEVLVVTLVNSAVDNFRRRIAGFLQEQGMVPGLGYRVRTLHSLAHEIVSHAPGLVGLETNFSVVDERISDALVGAAFAACYPRYERLMHTYLIDDLSDFQKQRVLEQKLPDLLKRVVWSSVLHFKNHRVTPADIRGRLQADSPALAHLAVDVYQRYQHGLDTRGAVDFADLITASVLLLEADPTLVERLREQWPFILEDEAQDSSELQELILRKMVGDGGNWVRVGDPNQAIFETFTTAHPKYLRQFLEEADAKRDLPNSGRSGRPIINLANELARWVREDHPIVPMRSALNLPLIEPTHPGDPQPNPGDEQCRVNFDFRDDAPEKEIARVTRSVSRWLQDHDDETVAILVPTNAQAAQVIAALEEAEVPHTDALLRLTGTTRKDVGALNQVLKHLSLPGDARTLVRTYEVWFRRVLREDETTEGLERLEEHMRLVGGCDHTESFIWPAPGQDGLEFAAETAESATEYLLRFRAQLQRWHGLVLLPIGELLTAIAQDLFSEPEQLDMTQVLSEILLDRSQYPVGSERRATTLDDHRRELVSIARDRRRESSLEADRSGFDPEEHRGKVVVATVHKGKGLEWDRVYLPWVNDYEFPSGSGEENAQREPWYLRDRLSLAAETMAILDAILNGQPYEEGPASIEAGVDSARERLRLLYVGITRARKELMVTANVGFGKNGPALAFTTLQKYAQEGADEVDGE